MPRLIFVSNLKLRKFCGKIKMVFRENDLQRHRFKQSVKLLKEFEQNVSRQHYCLLNFSKAFDSIHRENMEQIFLAYNLS